MAEAVVSVVLETLHDLMLKEASFLSNVSDQVQQVQNEMRRMLGFLRDADSKQSKDETVRNWLREIRSLAYRIEDILETYAVRVATRYSTSSSSSRKRGAVKKFVERYACLCREMRWLHKIGTEIEKIKSDISSLTGSLQRYDIRAIERDGESSSTNQNQSNQQWARQTYAHEVENYFVGMENDIAALVKLVVDPEKKHPRIISIYGMGGLGKTTLARKIYNQVDVERWFELFAWTCVTQQAEIRGILQDLLNQLLFEKENDVKSMGVRELVQQLHKVQTERKCLVVLDDLWKVEHWESIRAAFHDEDGSNSKILITTRQRKVAEIGSPYPLQCLSPAQGWELLQKIAFSGRRRDLTTISSFKDVGMELVSKCGFLPLAILVLGGVLKDKDSLTDWKVVNENIRSYLNNMEDNGEKNEGSIDQILSLSYNDLQYHLKLCFLYFGIQDNEAIAPRQMFLLWQAEGLALSKHQRPGEPLWEVAKRYVNELGNKCMVQLEVDEISLNKTFVTCRLHDLMRDFCLKKGQEEEFIRTVTLNDVKGIRLLDNTAADHRLVIRMGSQVHDDDAKTICAQKDWKQTRSLIFLNANFKDGITVWPQNVVLQNVKLLRVLQFKGFDFRGRRTLPLELQELIHLRMLSFLHCILDELPSCVADLPFLETLQLVGEFKIPNVIWKMKRLKYLQFPEVYFTDGGKLRLNGLKALEALRGFQAEHVEIADLSELVNLRDLEAIIKDNENLYALIDFIENRSHLRSVQLTIADCDFSSTEEGYGLLVNLLRCPNLRLLDIRVKLVEFPRYVPSFLQNLTDLRFSKNKMEEDPMEALGQIPQLRRLRFYRDSYMGKQLVCHEQGFPQLRYLKFCELPNLEVWKVDRRSLHNLLYIKIQDCKKLAMVPDGLRFVEGLKAVTFIAMAREFCDRVRMEDGQEGPDYFKIKHVPSVTIINPL